MRRAVRERALTASVALAAGLAGATPIADGDVFWHLAAGREIVRTGAVPVVDTLSAGAAGRPWVDLHWLFQLGVYAVEQLGGLGALVLAKCALVGVGAALLLHCVPRTARPALAIWLCSALLAARHLLLMRPVLVSLVLLAWFFLQLERHRRTGDARALWLLPPAQLLWSNCQGLFALGPALLFCYAFAAMIHAIAGDARGLPFAAEHAVPRAQRPGVARIRARALWTTAAACLGSALVTPYGLRALLLPLSLFDRLLPHAGNPYQHVAENVPPFILERLEPGSFWHLPFYLGSLAVAFVFGRRRMLLSHLLILGGMLGLALLANRNVLLLYWLATPIAALQLAPGLRRVRAWSARRHLRPALRIALPVMLAAQVVFASTLAALEPDLRSPTPFRFPIHSARYLQRAAGDGEGAIFGADHQGGYLIWTLGPRLRPYMDTRLVLRTPEEFAEYLGLTENPERFPAFQRRQRFAYAILPVAYPDRYLGLIAQLYRDPEWKLIFTNGSETLFARHGLSAEASWDLQAVTTGERLLHGIAAEFGADPTLHEAARISAARLALAVDAAQQAERMLLGLNSAAAQSLRSRARFAAGDLDGAQRLCELRLRQDGDDIRCLDSLAAIAMRRGQLESAARYLTRAAALDPFDAETLSLRATLERRHDR